MTYFDNPFYVLGENGKLEMSSATFCSQLIKANEIVAQEGKLV